MTYRMTYDDEYDDAYCALCCEYHLGICALETTPNDEGWMRAAQKYLDRLGAAEWAAHVDGMSRQDRMRATSGLKRLRYQPSEYHRDMVRLLGLGDREGWVQLKAQRGCDSALGA